MSIAAEPELAIARTAVISYLGAQDGARLDEILHAFGEMGLGIPSASLVAAVVSLAHGGSVVWSDRIWLEKRSAARAIEGEQGCPNVGC